MIAAHLGIIDEEAIDNMSFIFFEDVLSELGKKLNYDAIVNYAGNSFCQKSWEMIQEAYPMGSNKKNGMDSVASFFDKAVVHIKNANTSPDALGPTK